MNCIVDALCSARFLLKGSVSAFLGELLNSISIYVLNFKCNIHYYFGHFTVASFAICS